MKLTIIGHGYVGLVTAAVFSDLDNSVWVIGRDKKKIDKLKKGEVLFFEPGLKEVVKRNLKAGRLNFTLDYKKAIPDSKIVFICVGTPPGASGEADLSNVFKVAENIGKHIKNYTVVVCKSTVPVGTNKKLENLLNKKMRISSAKFDVASCPEFLREGTALSDTLHPDRIVIGTQTERAKRYLLDLHKPIAGDRILTNIETAEMIKYAANAFLAAKISFANALAFLCEKVEADIEKVMDGIGVDQRIGRSFLYPGVGYGGSCFPKDVRALIKTAENHGEDLAFLREVESINKKTINRFVEKIVKALKGNLSKKTIGILGLAFKPNTDDIREAPSIKIIKKLLTINPNLTIKAYDPAASKNVYKLLPDVIYCQNSYEAVQEADVLLVITEWNEFRQLDLLRIKKLLKKPIVVDGRNIYDPLHMKELGFQYLSVGRP